MSRGPGRIERAIKELFAANPDLAFGVIDLVEHCYPDITEPEKLEKKHTVSVIRAARRVVDSDPDWTIWRGEGQGGALVFVNQASLQSHCLAWLMIDNSFCYRSPKRAVRGYWGEPAKKAALMTDDRASLLALLEPGGRERGLFERRKKFVDLHIAQRDSDPQAAEMRDELVAELDAVLGKGWGLQILEETESEKLRNRK